jgi:RNA polymerase-binding transcription factor DksA
MPTQDDAAAETRARLEAERAEVLEELEGLRARLETRGNYSLGDGDPMIYQWELNLALFRRAEARLGAINEALLQLDKGAYGRCEECGTAIDPERLAVLPYTRVCSKCAEPKPTHGQRRR